MVRSFVNGVEILSGDQYDQVDEVLHFTDLETALKHFGATEHKMFQEPLLRRVDIGDPSKTGRKGLWTGNYVNVIGEFAFKLQRNNGEEVIFAFFTHDRPTNGRKIGVLNTRHLLEPPKPQIGQRQTE